MSFFVQFKAQLLLRLVTVGKKSKNTDAYIPITLPPPPFFAKRSNIWLVEHTFNQIFSSKIPFTEDLGYYTVDIDVFQWICILLLLLL